MSLAQYLKDMEEAEKTAATPEVDYEGFVNGLTDEDAVKLASILDEVEAEDAKADLEKQAAECVAAGRLQAMGFIDEINRALGESVEE